MRLKTKQGAARYGYAIIDGVDHSVHGDIGIDGAAVYTIPEEGRWRQW